MLECSCYECGVGVPRAVRSHFTAEDGRILCDSCSIGVKPCSERVKALLIDAEENE